MILSVLGQIKNDWSWREKLVLDTKAPVEVDDCEDDFNRELAFFNITREAVADVHAKLLAADIPTTRADDFYAEMIKSDDHMQRVKSQLIHQQTKMKAFEKRKQEQHNQKYQKELQQARQNERNRQKKKHVEAVESWRKQRKRGTAKMDELEKIIGRDKNRGRRGGGRGGGRGRGRSVSLRRAFSSASARRGKHRC